MKSGGKTAAVIGFLILFSALVAGVSINPSGDVDVSPGETVTVTASSDQTVNSLWLEHWNSETNEWETTSGSFQMNCEGGCSTSAEYTSLSSSSEKVRTKVSDDGENRKAGPIQITWSDEDNQAVVESVSMKPSGKLERSSESAVTVEATAQGQNLNTIWIERWSSSQGEWITDVYKGSGCDGSSCKISNAYSGISGNNVRLRAKAVASVDGQTDEGTSTETEINWVGDDTEPTASFTVSDTSPTVGQIVSFDASGSSGDSLSYDWDFGDGGSSSRVSPSHSYSAVNTYTVSLTVTEPDGDSDTATETIRVQSVQPPEPSLDASFTVSDRTPRVGQSVSFDASSSSGDIQDYHWFFGDGLTGSGRTTSHVYESTGSYTATLIVDDGEGNSATATKTVNVQKAPRKKCGVVVGNLNLDLDEIESGGTSQVSLPVSNSGDSQRIRVEFSAGEEFFRDTVTLASGGSKTFRSDLSVQSDANVRAKVSTVNGPCGSGTRATRTAFLEVTETSEERGTLEVHVEDENNEDLEFARVEVENGDRKVRFTDENGDESFELEPGSYDVEVSKKGYETKEKDVEIESGETENLDFELRRDDERGSLTVLVEDSRGRRLNDARVNVNNGDNKFERTDVNGRAFFRLEPSEYDISVSKDGYRTKTREVDIDAGESNTVLLTLQRKDGEGLEITDVSHSNSVCRGRSLSVDVTVDNRRGFHESVRLSGNGLGSNIVNTSFSLRRGERSTRTIRFTNVKGSGSESFRITANNHESDSVTRSVNVRSCNIVDRDDPSSITMKAVPDRTVIGNAVKVSGYVDGVRGRSTVEVSIDGKRKARTSTQPDGFYQVFVRPDKIGRQMVKAEAGDQSASQEIQVIPTANVNSVQAPRKVFEGETFEVCADVQSQVAPKVVLERDKRIVETRNSNGEVCFERTAEEPGTHLYSVKAFTFDQSSSASTTVEVLETRSEVESFPGKVASVESEEELVKVELYNTNEQLQRYDVSLEGVPSTWYSQSEQEVLLSKGESETVYFYLTPREETKRDATVSVSSRGSEVFRKDVTLEIGGTKRPAKKSLLDKITRFF